MSRWKAASSAVRPIKIGQMTDGLYAVVMDVPAFHAARCRLAFQGSVQGSRGARSLLSRRSALSSHEFQLFFHVCSTDLGVANGGLDGWGPFHGHMPQIIGDLFQRPASLAGTMRKIVA